ncbi:LPS export ABC transporter permease LptG [Pyruvatibacter sp.]|uniref:LPS export ABC transporter permease LptG n=1 Tax=Pyruvatibacter sp. TaxID=1981328 RepID=UPI0032EEC785
MRLPWTMYLYFGRRVLFAVIAAFIISMALAFVIDFVELLRRTGSREVPFGTVLTMGLLRLPSISEKMMPFSMLFGSMWAFLQLSRSNEFVVARASGVSAWQFLAPAVVLALFIGVGAVAVYNPLASAMVSRFEALESEHVRGRTSLLAVSESGLWLRQADEAGQSVIHALGATNQGVDLRDVIIFLYGNDEEFTGRIDADTATLAVGRWQISNAQVTIPGQQRQFHEMYELPTSLTLERVQESFASPDTLSFWDLPEFIETAQEAGFSALRYELHWHQLASRPFLMAAMVLIAACFSLRLTRLGGIGQLIVAGVVSGFFLYFFTDVTLALGARGVMPVVLAAWSPAFISAMLGAALIFHQEDG